METNINTFMEPKFAMQLYERGINCLKKLFNINQDLYGLLSNAPYFLFPLYTLRLYYKQTHNNEGLYIFVVLYRLNGTTL